MGAALVGAFAAAGANVVSLDRSVAAGTEVAAAAGPGGATFVACDVSDPHSVADSFRQSAAILGGLDVLVHAAGIAPGEAAESIPPDEWDLVMAVNARGTLLTNQAAFGLLKDHGGRIINFASAAGVSGYPGKAHYAASKGAVVAWTRTVAREWALHGITVNAIVPAIWTPMYETTRAAMNAEQLAAHDRQLAASIPLGGKLGNPDLDLVPLLVFLAGSGSRFITGQLFPVDGGMLMVR
jgi:NAD(P)-dependent dehydrogenase (short-subunit alcohol dehydrogenase family)